MADFCKQCSFEMWGEDMRDLADISTPTDTENGMFAMVICEGCGPTQVNHEGACVRADCDCEHGLRFYARQVERVK